jgi:hypothetical protein
MLSTPESIKRKGGRGKQRPYVFIDKKFVTYFKTSFKKAQPLQISSAALA